MTQELKAYVKRSKKNKKILFERIKKTIEQNTSLKVKHNELIDNDALSKVLKISTSYYHVELILEINKDIFLMRANDFLEEMYDLDSYVPKAYDEYSQFVKDNNFDVEAIKKTNKVFHNFILDICILEMLHYLLTYNRVFLINYIKTQEGKKHHLIFE